MRLIALLTLLCACTSFSNDERDRLASYQRNAAYYFEGGKLEQTLIQVERGLEIDPDDYKLNAIKGAVLLRASRNDYKVLDQASALLTKVYEWRSPSRHEPYLLLNYALAEQKQGLRRLGEAISLEGQAARATQAERTAELAGLALQNRRQASERLTAADQVLAVLIDRGELLRIAHKHRLQIARQLGLDKEFLESANAFLAQSEKDQAATRKEVENTTTPDYEVEQYRFLQSLKEEELEVRALLADWHYNKKEFEAALAQLNRVLEIDPKRSVDYYNRGRVLVELQKSEQAKADFTLFLATSTLPASSDKKTFATDALKR